MEERETAAATEEGTFILVPAIARDEIGQLTFYLEQGLRSLRDIAEHLRGSSGTMPSVLDDLKEVVKMTEAATVRVLEETEALVDEARAATKLLTEVTTQARAAGVEILTEPMTEIETLVERSHTRAMAIMSALEFQDLTTQKVQRTFNVLEEVLLRLGKIRKLVDNGDHPLAPPKPVSASAPNGVDAQSLADELLMNFAGEAKA
jgi:chemotaxis regulatin CheY-phosphate phosphatase CheZ